MNPPAELPRPMEPVQTPQPFDHPDWVFQLKWDGVRLLALHRGGDTRLFTRRLRECTAQFPEVAGAVRQACGSRAAVLDGEAVVLRAGRPWFPDVLRRLRAGPAPAGAPCVHYAVFDMLRWEDHPLTQLPLEERLRRLGGLEAAGLIPVTAVPGAGKALFDLAVQHEWEGVVAKRAGSPYVPGKSGLWRKCRRRQRHLFAVIGCAWRGRRAAALLLGGYRQDELVYCGRAGTGLTDAEWEQLGGVIRSSPPLAAAGGWPGRLDGTGVSWVAPSLTVWVDFLEWTATGRLRHPVIVGFSAQPPQAAWV